MLSNSSEKPKSKFLSVGGIGKREFAMPSLVMASNFSAMEFSRE